MIEISHLVFSGADVDDYERIDTKVSYKLAQRPGSYVVLEYRRLVVKNKRSRPLSTRFKAAQSSLTGRSE